MTDEDRAPDHPYLAAIGDLIGSRTMDDRSSVRERVQEAIHQVKETFEEGLVAPVELTGSDEWKVLVGESPRVVPAGCDGSDRRLRPSPGLFSSVAPPGPLRCFVLATRFGCGNEGD